VAPQLRRPVARGEQPAKPEHGDCEQPVAHDVECQRSETHVLLTTPLYLGSSRPRQPGTTEAPRTDAIAAAISSEAVSTPARSAISRPSAAVLAASRIPRCSSYA